MGPILLRHPPVRNRLLAALPEAELQQLRACLTPVRLVPGQVLIEHGQKTEHAFFIEDGLVSLVADSPSSRTCVQVAMIGAEGLIGCQALVGADTGAFVSAITQIPGAAWRIPVADLRRIAESCPALQQLCQGAVMALMHQAMQTASCNARNTLAERCVRWLLMAHDRAEGDDVAVTHEALSGMLGVRRSGVTVAVAELQDAGLVRVSRGRITILNRAGLEREARDTPWTVQQSAERSMPEVMAFPPARANPAQNFQLAS